MAYSDLLPSSRPMAPGKPRFAGSTLAILGRHCLAWCLSTGGVAYFVFEHGVLGGWLAALFAVLVLAGTTTGAAAFFHPLSDLRGSRSTFIVSGWASVCLITAACWAGAAART